MNEEKGMAYFTSLTMREANQSAEGIIINFIRDEKSLQLGWGVPNKDD